MHGGARHQGGGKRTENIITANKINKKISLKDAARTPA